MGGCAVKFVTAIPEVLEAYGRAGAVDCLPKIVVPDISGYDRVYKRLIKVVELTDGRKCRPCQQA